MDKRVILSYAEDNSDVELADDYEPSYEDYEGAAQQMFDDDDFYYDFLGKAQNTKIINGFKHINNGLKED